MRQRETIVPGAAVEPRSASGLRTLIMDPASQKAQWRQTFQLENYPAKLRRIENLIVTLNNEIIFLKK